MPVFGLFFGLFLACFWPVSGLFLSCFCLLLANFCPVFGLLGMGWDGWGEPG